MLHPIMLMHFYLHRQMLMYLVPSVLLRGDGSIDQFACRKSTRGHLCGCSEAALVFTLQGFVFFPQLSHRQAAHH